MPTELEFYEKAKATFLYTPLDGKLLNRWYRSSNAKKMDEAGGINQAGYRVVMVSIDGKQKLMSAHRIIWFIVHGYIPTEIDHINRVRDDNRIENLREVCRGENARNKGMHARNKVGLKGVTWHKPGRKYRANIFIDGKSKHLGYFVTAEEAHAAYLEAAEKRDGVAYREEPGENQWEKGLQ